MRFLEAVTGYVAAALLVAFTVIILVDVVFRYWLKIPLTWPAESSVLLFQWGVFLGAALAVRRRMHFGLAVVTAVSVMLVVLGLDMTGRTWPSLYATLPLSHGVAYLGVAVSGALMLVFTLPHLVAFWHRGAHHAPPR